MTDRYNIHSQLEHLQSKYVGTGHSDTTKFEWLVNQHRDSAASYIGHYNLLDYFALVENESRARTKFNLLEEILFLGHTDCKIQAKKFLKCYNPVAHHHTDLIKIRTAHHSYRFYPKFRHHPCQNVFGSNTNKHLLCCMK